MLTHDALLAEENHDWEELMADDKLARLSGFILEKGTASVRSAFGSTLPCSVNSE
jgi:hypothetical protein